MSYVNVIHEVKRCEVENEWVLCFQYCEYFYDDNTSETGYRFIWRKPNGALQPARGQARIPKMSDLLYLVSKAMKQGWGNLEEKEVDLKENVISQIEED